MVKEPYAATYMVTSILSLLASVRQRGNSPLIALSGLLAALAIVNYSIESKAIFANVRADQAIDLLIAIFLLPYVFLSIELMEKREGMKWPVAALSSWLPLIVILFLSLCVALQEGELPDNPALTLLVGLALICVLHVPMFAYGKSSVVKTMQTAGIRSAGRPKLTISIVVRAAFVLWIPPLVLLAVQMRKSANWTQFSADVVITAAVFSLFVIARR